MDTENHFKESYIAGKFSIDRTENDKHLEHRIEVE